MKKFIPIFVLFLFLSSLLPAKVHTWKSANGYSFEGSFLNYGNGQVQLKGTDGKIISVLLELLDVEGHKHCGTAKILLHAAQQFQNLACTITSRMGSPSWITLILTFSDVHSSGPETSPA
ncbi:MAG: hypothetical protein ACO3N7_09960 [Kiritimatiellia bacterium]